MGVPPRDNKFSTWEFTKGGKTSVFYGIEEDPEGAEDTRQVLIDFLQSELDIDDASDIEFQRVHRIGRFNQQAPKPRQIIVRFLRYPDCERVMSNAKKLKSKNFGISADLPKEIVDRRKEGTA